MGRGFKERLAQEVIWVRLDQRDQQAYRDKWEIEDQRAHGDRQAHRGKPPIQEKGDLQAHKAQQDLAGRKGTMETAGQRARLGQRVPRAQLQQCKALKASLDQRGIRATRGTQGRTQRA